MFARSVFCFIVPSIMLLACNTEPGEAKLEQPAAVDEVKVKEAEVEKEMDNNLEIEMKKESDSARLPLDSNAKYVYLSFDDGPLYGTSSCINICEQENVKATFFQVGIHQARSKWGKLLHQRILDQPDLFLLTNHSYSHTYGKYSKFYKAPDAALEDFKQAAQVLATKNNIVRLPGNNGWSTERFHSTSRLVRPVVRKLDSAGFNVIGWDAEWNFTKTGRPIESAEKMAFIVDSMFKYNENRTKNHLVLLMHDIMFRSPEDSTKLAQFIQYLKKGNKYQFALLDQYPGLKK